MADLYTTIETLIKEKGYSLHKLSELSGVPYTCLANIKSGRNKGMNAKNLSKLATALNVSIEELTTGKIKKEPPITDSPHSSIDDVIISELNMLDEEKKRKALRFIMNLADE